MEIAKRAPLWASRLGVSVSQHRDVDWRSPGSDIVGAVIEAADVQGPANKPEDYNPTLPPPDMGFLPQDTPLEVFKEPGVDVSEIGEEMVFSARLALFLASLCVGKVGEVRYRGLVLPGFKRLFPQSRGAVLSELN